MTRRNNDLEKVTVNLRWGDMSYLHTVASGQNIPASILVRTIVSQAVDKMREREKPVQLPEVEL